MNHAKKSMWSTIGTVFFSIICVLYMYPIVMVVLNSFKKETAITTATTFDVPTAETFYKNVYRLEPGHTLTFKDGKAEINCFFRPEYVEKEQTFDEAVEKIQKAMKESSDMQTEGVNFGSFLSGGVDSSYMVSLSKPENTFTVGYENQNYDESVYSSELAQVLGIKNHVRLVNSKEYLSSFKDIVYGMDEPVADPSAAVYAANDIVYYEDGHDFAYGEGTETDAHTAEEANAHTVIHITQPGTYALSGKLSAGQVAVDLGETAENDPHAVVTLILNGGLFFIVILYSLKHK